MSVNAQQQGSKRIRLAYNQFESHCKAYLSHRDSARPQDAASLSWQTYAKGWQWLPPIQPDSPAFYPSACLHRSFSLLLPYITTSKSNTVDRDELVLDEAEHEDPTSPIPMQGVGEIATVSQSVSWSPIWQLPILYFHANDSSGQPLSIDQMKQTNIVFRQGTLPREKQEVIGGGGSVGDHPRSGLPVYYLHPCENEGAMGTLLGEKEESGAGGQARREGAGEGEGKEEEGWRYIAAFISLCASAVEMRAT